MVTLPLLSHTLTYTRGSGDLGSSFVLRKKKKVLAWPSEWASPSNSQSNAVISMFPLLVQPHPTALVARSPVFITKRYE